MKKVRFILWNNEECGVKILDDIRNLDTLDNWNYKKNWLKTIIIKMDLLSFQIFCLDQIFAVFQDKIINSKIIISQMYNENPKSFWSNQDLDKIKNVTVI